MANNDVSKHNNFNNNQDDSIPENFDAKTYNLSGKIMLCAIVFLFFVVIVMLSLHIYARWYLLRARQRHLRRNRLRRRTQLIFYTDNPTAAAISSTSTGLDSSVIASLPLFLYDPNTHPEVTSECAVCLSEFESGETGRVLPKCNHAFHTECIDMWFISHSTCPLCRAPVEPTQTRSEVTLNVFGSEPGSSSDMGLEENRTGRDICSSSVGLRRKPSFVGVTIEVPSRNEDVRCDSPSTQSSFRSPMSRMLSLKRILSRDRKGNVSPSSCGGCGCSSAAELDVERGGRDETQ